MFEIHCSFCGAGALGGVPLIRGGGGVICRDCVLTCLRSLFKHGHISPVAQREWIEGSDDSNLGWWDFEPIENDSEIQPRAEPLFALPAKK